MVGPAVFLASNASDFVNGQILFTPTAVFWLTWAVSPVENHPAL